jgi:N-acetylglutamate synthase-like GNAT family acetyltransferase
MIIQLATQQNLEFLNDIMQCSKAYWGYDADFMKTFIKNFGLTSDYIDQKNTFVASSDNGTIGFYSFSITSDNQLELDNFFLHPNYIGKGFGREMWNYCTAMAKNYNVPSFVLWSDPNAEKFYQRMGCIKIGERQSPMMPNRYPSIFRYELQ